MSQKIILMEHLNKASILNIQKYCEREASILNILIKYLNHILWEAGKYSKYSINIQKYCEREASILNILMKYLNKILWEAGKYSKFQFNSKISCFPAFYSEPLVNILFRRMIIFFVIRFNILTKRIIWILFKFKFESWTMKLWWHLYQRSLD